MKSENLYSTKSKVNIHSNLDFKLSKKQTHTYISDIFSNIASIIFTFIFVRFYTNVIN